VRAHWTRYKVHSWQTLRSGCKLASQQPECHTLQFLDAIYTTLLDSICGL